MWFKGAANCRSSFVPIAPSIGDSRSFFYTIICCSLCTCTDLKASLDGVSTMRSRFERAAEFEKFLFFAVELPPCFLRYGAFSKGFDELFLVFVVSWTR